MKLQSAPHLLLLVILQLYRLPPPLSPPVSDSSRVFPQPASVCTGLYHFTFQDCEIKDVLLCVCVFAFYVFICLENIVNLLCVLSHFSCV